jgi:hypothetical protein
MPSLFVCPLDFLLEEMFLYQGNKSKYYHFNFKPFNQKLKM